MTLVQQVQGMKYGFWPTIIHIFPGVLFI